MRALILALGTVGMACILTTVFWAEGRDFLNLGIQCACAAHLLARCAGRPKRAGKEREKP